MVPVCQQKRDMAEGQQLHFFCCTSGEYLEGAGGGTVGPIIQRNITKNTFEFGNFLKIIIPFFCVWAEGQLYCIYTQKFFVFLLKQKIVNLRVTI